jgi:hypothetical protein
MTPQKPPISVLRNPPDRVEFVISHHCACGDQDQGFHRCLPFRRLALGLRQLRDVVPGILERDELAAAGQRDRLVERALPSADQQSRCGLIRSDAVEGRGFGA